MHISLHGKRHASRRGRKAIGRCFAVSSTLLAIAFDVLRSAKKTALARKTNCGHTGNDIGEPGANRKRRMLERIGDKAAVQPRLIHIANLKSKCLGNAIVVDAYRPPEMD